MLTVAPAWVDTEMTKNIKKKFLNATPEECGRGILKGLGSSFYVPGAPKHWLFDFTFRLFPTLGAKRVKTPVD